MAKQPNLNKKNPAVKETVSDPSAFAFGRENFILLFIALGLLLIGYVLMSGGKAESPEVYNPEVFSFRRITLAPLIVMAGYAVGIWAILKKSK